jgi:UDP-2-acetamido-2-deoxy-ribo-hexuluronate aminotransferase
LSTKQNIKINNPISFIDLAAQQKILRTQIDASIKKVLDHGNYILGPEVEELEQKLADFVGVRNCIGVSSGTDALLMVLMARGIGPGDAVFTTPFTFIATSEVISLLGATPVFVDIDPHTYNIDPAMLELAIQAIRKNDPAIYPLPQNRNSGLDPKSIIPVDLFGLPADYDPIMKLAKKYDLFVLEDAAQGLGGIYKGRQAGSLAHAAATSFFPAKPLGCYGDGGAILTDDDTLADSAHSIRVHGKGTDKYNNVRIGLNARLDTLQAAILLSKLEVFPHEIEERQRVAKRYTHGFSGCEKLTIPHIPDGLQSIWAQYSLLAEERATLQAQLKEQGIPTAVYYGRPLHLQPAYSNLGYKHEDMPVSERVSQQVLSLPMHPYLPDDEIDRIVEAVLQAV